MPDYGYLSSDPMRTRQLIAAYYVRAARHILEIGGGAEPLTGYLLQPPDSIHVVDPEIEPYEADCWQGRPCRIRHLRLPMTAWWPGEVAPDAVVALGFVGWDHMERADVLPLMERADAVVLECSPQHKGGWCAMRELTDALPHRIVAQVSLTCRGDGVPFDCRYQRRELFVLERRHGS